MSPAMARHRLVLVRHAKSRYPYGVPDHERPLAGKGLRNARAAAQWFRDEGPHPDLIITSDAVRARHTAQLIAAGLSKPPEVRWERRLYLSGSSTLVSLARSTPSSVSTLVMVGHEPTMSDAVLLLAGPGSRTADLERVSAKFATNGIAVLLLEGPWASLRPRGAILERFEVPRA